MDPVGSIDNVTALVVGSGALVTFVIGFAKRFGGKRFVLAKKLFSAFAKLVAAIDSKLS